LCFKLTTHLFNRDLDNILVDQRLGSLTGLQALFPNAARFSTKKIPEQPNQKRLKNTERLQGTRFFNVVDPDRVCGAAGGHAFIPSAGPSVVGGHRITFRCSMDERAIHANRGHHNHHPGWIWSGIVDECPHRGVGITHNAEPTAPGGDDLIVYLSRIGLVRWWWW
jgi:hypothetical protein